MHIIVFFTFDISLKTWAETGLLQREIVLYKELISKYGVEVTFLTYGNSSDRAWEKQLDGIKLLPAYERYNRSNNRFIRGVATILILFLYRRELKNATLFKTNQIWGGWIAAIAKFIFQKPLLVRCGNEFYDFTLRSGCSKLFKVIAFITSWITYKSGDIVQVATKRDKILVNKNFGIKTERIIVRPNWIDTIQFNSIPKTERLSKVLFVGRLTEQKNITLLFDALSNTEVSVDIYGAGKLKKKLKLEAKKRKVIATFKGRVSNEKMPLIYNKYRVYVLCSNYEGNPKTLLEAMACKCAVVGTNVVGIKEIIDNGRTGVLTSENPEDLKRAIFSILNNKDYMLNLGESARNEVVRRNSLSFMVGEEFATYIRLISRP